MRSIGVANFVFIADGSRERVTVFDPVGETQILIRDAMVGRAKLTVGLVLGALCLIAACVGVALLIAAHAMPAHVDERRAAQLTGLYEHNYVSETDEQREPIEREIASLRTSKWKLIMQDSSYPWDRSYFSMLGFVSSCGIYKI